VEWRPPSLLNFFLENPKQVILFMREVATLKNQLSKTIHDLSFLRIYGVGGWISNLSSGLVLMYLYTIPAFVAVALRRIRKIRQLLATSRGRSEHFGPPTFSNEAIGLLSPMPLPATLRKPQYENAKGK